MKNLDDLRHSAAHLLAAAVMEIWPKTKRTIGPSIEDGFYFDFDFGDVKVTEDDFSRIEDKMREIGKTWKGFERHELSADEAKKEYPDNEYKHELIDEFASEGQTLTFYKSGEYWDLCRGGHVENPQDELKHFKLISIAGAYWRGDSKNKMLTRIYGTAFYSKEELDQYLAMREEAKKRDHKKIGPELDLFTFSPLVGAGLPLWTPKGTIVRNLLDGFVWELRQAYGYQKVAIPHITKKDLYETSGHWAKFADELFRIETREGHEFAMKPMNCPHHTQIFASRPRSYRDMPQRYAETTMVYRDEQSGELAGLSRVRSITQDDAHVFCSTEQLDDEMEKIYSIIQKFYSVFGFELKPRLSTHDPAKMENYLGDEDKWITAEKKLEKMLVDKGIEYLPGVGEAAFYGPKIDFMTKDAIGRTWQVATLQLDINMPERFDLFFMNNKGERERIFMIHAAIMGSIERFMSILIEHFAGAFPLWLSPVQVAVLPVSEKVDEYARKVEAELVKAGVRVELDNRSESLGNRIRYQASLKTPIICVVGEKEAESGQVSIRERGKEVSEAYSLADFIKVIRTKIEEKSLS